jgi:hypothetical protein
MYFRSLRARSATEVKMPRAMTVVINYVGHAEGWDKVQIEGSLEARDCAVSYKRGNRTLAVATISRDLQSLRYEAALESGQI